MPRITIHYPPGCGVLRFITLVGNQLVNLLDVTDEMIPIRLTDEIRSRATTWLPGSPTHIALSSGEETGPIRVLDMCSLLRAGLDVTTADGLLIRTVQATRTEQLPVAYQAALSRHGWDHDDTLGRLDRGELFWTGGGYGLPYITDENPRRARLWGRRLSVGE